MKPLLLLSLLWGGDSILDQWWFYAIYWPVALFLAWYMAFKGKDSQ